MKMYERDMSGRLKEVARELRMTRAETKRLGVELTRKKDEIRQLKAQVYQAFSRSEQTPVRKQRSQNRYDTLRCYTTVPGKAPTLQVCPATEAD